MIKYGSVCSGIESASVAWEPLGMSPAWFAEIEPFPSAVLAHRWPDVPNLGDMTTIRSRLLSGEIEAPDVLVGGTPCQAFSVAGKRESLDDGRGQLSLEYVRILNAIDIARTGAGKPPAICLWENVPGVLNTKDNAFGCFLGALAGEDDPLQPAGKKWTNAGCVFGPQRTVVWRTLDAQHFGLAQRRKRVFVVASARHDIRLESVLFEFESLRRDSPPRREAEKETAADAGESTVERGYRMAAFGEYADDQTASTLKARDYKDATDLVLAFPAEMSATQVASTQNLSPALSVKHTTAVVKNSVVRRLTPKECERLQGFPDDHTKFPYRNKPAEHCPDGPRYKAIGNSKAVPVVRWIGRRLLTAIRETHQ